MAAVAGPLVVGDGTHADTATNDHRQANQITGSVTVNGGSTFSAGGQNDTITTLLLNGGTVTESVPTR